MKISYDPEKVRRDLVAKRAAAKLADHIRKVVAEAPPLTAEQRDRIAALLRGSVQ